MTQAAPLVLFWNQIGIAPTDAARAQLENGPKCHQDARTDHDPYHPCTMPRNIIQRETGAVSSRLPMYSVDDNGDDARVTVERLDWKGQAIGYIALLMYLIVTQIAGVGFFQLRPENRAYWLVGAVLVLVWLFSLSRKRDSSW